MIDDKLTRVLYSDVDVWETGKTTLRFIPKMSARTSISLGLGYGRSDARTAGDISDAACNNAARSRLNWSEIRVG